MKETEVWFEVEYSRIGADDWFTTGNHFDSVEAAQRSLITTADRRTIHDFEYRVVKVEVTRSVVQP